MPYLMGIDVGTTHCKAGIYDADGREVSMAITETPVTNGEGGAAVHDPEALWQSICRVARSALAQAEEREKSPIRLDGVSVASMGEAGVPLDEHGSPLYPIIAWYDPRTAPQAKWWEETLGADKVFRATGLPLNPIFSLNKIMWLKEHEPEVIGRMRKWLSVADYVYFRLSGAIATEYSLASRTMALDLNARRWSEAFVASAGISADQLPDLYPSGTVVGHVSREAEEQCGIPAGTPVVTGGHDHVCGALGAGIIDAGGMLDSCGTAESLLGVFPGGISAVESGRGFAIGCHVVPGKYYLMGGLASSGVAMDWITGLFGANAGANAKAYAELMQEAASTSVGARGLVFLPHLRGSGPPVRDPSSRGAFLGLRPHHKQPELVRAVVEGLCLELRLTFDAASAVLESKPRYLRAIGGGTKNRFWLQTRADVLGVSIEVPQVKESTTLGAALLAGIGVGLYAGAHDAVRRTYQAAELVVGREEVHARYCALYEVFREVYPTLAGLSPRIGEFERISG